MYWERELQDDIFEVAKKYGVSYLKVEKVIFENHSSDNLEELFFDGIEQTSANFSKAIQTIRTKIKNNGRKINPDPMSEAFRLRERGEKDAAFQLMKPFMQRYPDDLGAKVQFGWIMYDYLKETQGHPKYFPQNMHIFNRYVKFSQKELKMKNVSQLNQAVYGLVKRVLEKGKLELRTALPEILFFLKNYEFMSQKVIKKLINRVGDELYFAVIDEIGFAWLEERDFKKNYFKNKAGKRIEKPLFVQTIFNYHMYRLLKAKEISAATSRMKEFLSTLKTVIADHINLEWLYYDAAKLALKLGLEDEIVAEFKSFACRHTNHSGVWYLYSQMVEEESAFNCLCAGLLCHAPEVEQVELQEKIVPLLVARKMFAEAKLEIMELNKTCRKHNRVFPEMIRDLQRQEWYKTTKQTSGRNSLQLYAIQAKELISSDLPWEDIRISSLIKQRDRVWFSYASKGHNHRNESGYFYKDTIPISVHDKIDQEFKVKMVKTYPSKEVFQILALKGDD